MPKNLDTKIPDGAEIKNNEETKKKGRFSVLVPNDQKSKLGRRRSDAPASMVNDTFSKSQ